MNKESRIAYYFRRLIYQPERLGRFFLLWTAIIMVLSVIPDNTPDVIEINIYEFRIDYLKHFLVFLPAGFSLWGLSKKGITILISAALVSSLLPEIVQYFIPYRTYNPFDMLSNLIGLVVGYLIFISIRKRSQKP